MIHQRRANELRIILILLASHYVTSQGYKSKDQTKEQIREHVQTLTPNNYERAAIRRDTQIDNNKDIFSRWAESRDASGNYKVYIAGSENNLYSIMHEIKETKVVKTEITIYFYFYRNKQFYYIRSHQTTFDILKSVLAKYPHYFYENDRTGEVGNRGWYVNNLIMIPGGDGRFIRSENLNIQHKDDDSDYDTSEYSLYPDKVDDYYQFDMPSSKHYKGKDINVDIGNHKNNHDVNVENVKKNSNLYQFHIPNGKNYKGKDINIDIDNSKENYEWVEHNANHKDANNFHFNIPHVNDYKIKDYIDTDVLQSNYKYFDSDGDNKEDSDHEIPRAEVISKSNMHETDIPLENLNVYETFYPEQNEKGYYEFILPRDNNYKGKDTNVDILKVIADNLQKQDDSKIEISSKDSHKDNSYMNDDAQVKSFPADNYNIFDVDHNNHYVPKQEFNNINPSHTNSLDHLKGKQINLPNNKNIHTQKKPCKQISVKDKNGDKEYISNDCIHENRSLKTNIESNAKLDEGPSTNLKYTNSNDDNSGTSIPCNDRNANSISCKNHVAESTLDSRSSNNMDTGLDYDEQLPQIQEKSGRYNPYNVEVEDIPLSNEHNIDESDVNMSAVKMATADIGDKGIDYDALPYLDIDNQEFLKNLDFIKTKDDEYKLHNICSQINSLAKLPHKHNIHKEGANVFINSDPNFYPSITATNSGAIRDISPCLRSLILKNKADLKLCEESTRAKYPKYLNTKPLQTSYKPTFFQKPYKSKQLSPDMYLPQESFATPQFDPSERASIHPSKHFNKNDYPFSYEPKVPSSKVDNPTFPINGFPPSPVNEYNHDILQQHVPLNNNKGGIHLYSKHLKTNFDTENKSGFAQQSNNGNQYDSLIKQINYKTPSEYFNFNPPFSQNRNNAVPSKLDSAPLYPKSYHSVIPTKNGNMFYQPSPTINSGLTWPLVSDYLNLPTPYTNKNTGINTPSSPKTVISPLYPAYRPPYKNIIPENHPHILNNVLNNGIHLPTPPQAYLKQISDEIYPVLSPQYDKIPISSRNWPLHLEERDPETRYINDPNILQKGIPSLENPQPQYSPDTQYIEVPNVIQKVIPTLQKQQHESNKRPFTFQSWPSFRNQQPQTQYGKMPILTQGFPSNIENQQPLIQYGKIPLTSQYVNTPPVNSLSNVSPSKYLQNTLHLPKVLNHANLSDKLNSYTPNESQLRLKNINQQPVTVPMKFDNMNTIYPKTFGESYLNPVSTNWYQNTPNLMQPPLFQYQPGTFDIPTYKYLPDKSTFPESKLKSSDKQRVLQEGFAYNSPPAHVLNPIHRFATQNSKYNNKVIANAKEYAPENNVYGKHSQIKPIYNKGNSRSTLGSFSYQNVNPQINQPTEYKPSLNQNMWLQNFTPNYLSTLDKQNAMTLSQPIIGPSQFLNDRNTLGYPVASYSSYLKQPFSFLYPCLKPISNLKTENYLDPSNTLQYRGPNFINFNLNNPEYLPETMNTPLISSPIFPMTPTTYFSRLNPGSPFITKINRLPQINFINEPYNLNILKPLYTENLASVMNSRGQFTPIKTIQTSPQTQKLDSNKNYPYLNYPSQFRRPLNSKESFIHPGQRKLYSDASNRQQNKLNTYVPSTYFKPRILSHSKPNYAIPNSYISNKQSRVNKNIPVLQTLGLNNYQRKKSDDYSTRNAYPYYSSLYDKIPYIYPLPIPKPINSLPSSPLLTQTNSPYNINYPNIPGFLNNNLPNKYGSKQNPKENPLSFSKYNTPIKNDIPYANSNLLENPKGQESKIEGYPMIYPASFFKTDRPSFENIPYQYPYLPGIIDKDNIDYALGSQFSPDKYYNPRYNNINYVNQNSPEYPYNLVLPKTLKVPFESDKPMYGSSPHLLSNNRGYVSPGDNSHPKDPLINNQLPSNNFNYENTIQEKPVKKLPGLANNPINSKWPNIKSYDSIHNYPDFKAKTEEDQMSNPYTTINPFYAPYTVQFQNPNFPRILNSQVPDWSQNSQSDPNPKGFAKSFDSNTVNLNPNLSPPYINSYKNIPSNLNLPRYMYNNQVKNDNINSQSIPYKSIKKPVTDHTFYPKLPKYRLKSTSTIPQPSIYNLKDLLNNKINQELPNILSRDYFDNNFYDPNPNAYDNIKINLGKIAVAKYNDKNRYLIKTDNSNVNLLAWRSKIKTINAKLVIDVQDYPAINFMPVVNGPISSEEAEKIARNTITRFYGEPIVVSGQFSSYEPYGVVFNEGVRDRYNVLWPTLCNCGCMSSGCKCQCRN